MHGTTASGQRATSLRRRSEPQAGPRCHVRGSGREQVPAGRTRRPSRGHRRLAVVVAWSALAAAVGAQPFGGSEGLIREGSVERLSAHVYVIPDNGARLVPNVGIVAGSRATLVVDTGLGPINAQTILREVARLRRGPDLFVVSTHYHAEHAAGEAAFPASATIVRARAQQQDIDELGAEGLLRFRTFSPLVAELLSGVQYRPADVIFEREHVLDLGGVRVRLLALGPTHTRGDTLVYVEEDGVLLAGDVVMNRQFPVFIGPTSSVAAWRAALEALAALDVRHVVPSHGLLGDGSLIGEQRTYLQTLNAQVRGLKAAGQSVDDTAERVTGAMQAAYPGWTGARWIGAAARSAYREAPAASPR